MADLVERRDLRRATAALTTTRARIASTLPSFVFPCPWARPDSAARAASMASAGSDLPVRRRLWRFGRSTSTTSTEAVRRKRARLVPYELVPSMPTRTTSPWPSRKPSSARLPAGVAGNSATASSPPIGSRAAATFVSRWVSTPPVTRRDSSTVVIAIPSLFVGKGWHATHHGATPVRSPCWRRAVRRTWVRLVPAILEAGRQIDSSDRRLAVSRFSGQAGASGKSDRSDRRHVGGGSPRRARLHTPCRLWRHSIGAGRSFGGTFCAAEPPMFIANAPIHQVSSDSRPFHRRASARGIRNLRCHRCHLDPAGGCDENLVSDRPPLSES